MADKTPGRFRSRVSGVPRRVGRALEGAVDSGRNYDDSLEVQADGRLGVRIASGGALRMTRKGLVFDESRLGEKNRDALAHMPDLSSSATTAELVQAFNRLLAEMKRTKNMRGGV